LENHLNYYHAGGAGLDARLAYGLATFVNSTIADLYFRQFNGHTQVNATDLRSLPYPNHAMLLRLADETDEEASQAQIDAAVERIVFESPTVHSR
jgi:adenine-specific DNA-methyltransferase